MTILLVLLFLVTAGCLEFSTRLNFTIILKPWSPKALDGKFVFFIHIDKCQSIYYNSVKFQVDRLQSKKVTIYPSALSKKVRHFAILILMLIDGSDEIGYFSWKFQSRALMT